MIETLKNSNLYKNLNLSKSSHHAYLFSSLDKELNNNIALVFAKSIICENKNCCELCPACKQFNSFSHPDVTILDQSSIKVEDVNNLISKLSTKPISSSHKVFVILNAENINEIAQNKLLKSFEEPNESTIFILTTSKIDKILPTILSRLRKINLPKIQKEDLKVCAQELKQSNIDLEKYYNSIMTLTEILDFETSPNHKNTINAIKYIFENLNSSQDIPRVASSLPEFDKTLFFSLLQKLFISCINQEFYLNEDVCNLINSKLSKQVLINCLPLVEDAYLKQASNVNFGYILDNLLFNILKEKFLCKQ